MPLVEIEVGLTDLELAIRDTAHKFPAEVLRPAGEKLDRMADPARRERQISTSRHHA